MQRLLNNILRQGLYNEEIDNDLGRWQITSNIVVSVEDCWHGSSQY